jgi:hypothetical protein
MATYHESESDGPKTRKDHNEYALRIAALMKEFKKLDRQLTQKSQVVSDKPRHQLATNEQMRDLFGLPGDDEESDIDDDEQTDSSVALFEEIDRDALKSAYQTTQRVIAVVIIVAVGVAYALGVFHP